MKSSNPTYNRREIRDKQAPDRSWCHLYHMYICGSMWLWYRSVHGSMGCDQVCFTLVWKWQELLSDSLPNGRLSLRLGRELFTLPSCYKKVLVPRSCGFVLQSTIEELFITVWDWCLSALQGNYVAAISIKKIGNRWENYLADPTLPDIYWMIAHPCLLTWVVS